MYLTYDTVDKLYKPDQTDQTFFWPDVEQRDLV